MNSEDNQSVQPKQNQAEALGLRSIRPKFKDELHGTYLRELNTALGEEESRNIALSGNYGVGKSSILQELVKDTKFSVLSLSLSALTPARRGDDSAEADPTNRIQREVVKQILYRARPSETPDSRFGRIDESTPWGQIIAASSVGGFVAWLVFVLSGWAENLSSVVFNEEDPNGWFFFSLFAALGLGLLSAIRFIWHPRHARLSEVNAGVATIKLDKGSTSYFDQYLDEIVYLFQRKKYDVVVFEDIDRFEDSEIFETLRALNTLLNEAPQIEQRPIRFVYAIKDSIFDPKELTRKSDANEQVSSEEAEAARANRTKFFDHIIPVVPFVSQHNAHELMSEVLEGIEHKIDPELLKLAGRYMPDMRLLKNTVNEYLVFHDRIFSGAGKQLKLEDTQLFAMMLYKNTNLGEFEKIRLGDSNLDLLFRDFERLRGINLERVRREAATTRTQLNRLGEESARAKELGERLLRHFNQAKGYFKQGANTSSGFEDPVAVIGGTEYEIDTVKTPLFWNQVANDEVDVQLRVGLKFSGKNFTLRKKDIREQLQGDIDDSEWQNPERRKLESDLQRLSAQERLLRSATLYKVWTQASDFRISSGEKRVSLDKWLKGHVGEGLVYDLVSDGFINENFTLYASTFHGRSATAKAINFILRHIQKNDPSPNFHLDPKDAKSVIEKQGLSVLRDPVAYNVYLLDYALAQGDRLASTASEQLARLGSDELDFLDTYLYAGTQQGRLVREITKRSEGVLTWLISDSKIREPEKLHELVSVALTALVSEKTYTVDDEVGRYLQGSWQELPVLLASRDEGAPESRAAVASVLESASLQVSDFSLVRHELWDEFRDRKLFRITAENLSLLLEGSQDQDLTIALDDLKREFEVIYEYCMANLGQYLDAVHVAGAHSIRTPEPFPEILEEAAERYNVEIQHLVAHSTESCRIEDLESVPDSTWPALAEHQRFPVTLGNISLYLTQREEFDEHLQSALQGLDAFLDVNEDQHEEKVLVAKALITQAKNLTPARRVRLIKSLHLDEPLDGADLSAEEGELFPRLLREGLIDDDIALYDHFTTLSWDTREKLIAESENFTSYITTETIAPEDLQRIFRSSKVPEDKKRKLLGRLADFVKVAPREGLQAAVEQALYLGEAIGLDEIQAVANEGVEVEDVLALMQPHLPGIALTELQNILVLLPDPYSRLAQRGTRPKLPHTPEVVSVIDALDRLGVVAGRPVKNDEINVSMKKGW